MQQLNCTLAVGFYTSLHFYPNVLHFTNLDKNFLKCFFFFLKKRISHVLKLTLCQTHMKGIKFRGCVQSVSKNFPCASDDDFARLLAKYSNYSAREQTVN